MVASAGASLRVEYRPNEAPAFVYLVDTFVGNNATVVIGPFTPFGVIRSQILVDTGGGATHDIWYEKWTGN